MDERKNAAMSDEQLTQELKGSQTAGTAAGVVMVIGIIIMVIGIFGVNIPMVVAGLLIAIVAGAIRNSSKKSLKKQISDNLVQSALEDVFDNVVYEPFGKMPSSRIGEAGIMIPESFDGSEGSDYIKASYKGLPVEMSDITLTETTEFYNEDSNMYEQNEKPVFKGQWLICDFGKELVADVRLATRTRMDRALKKATIATENEEFNRRFTVCSDNEQEAFYILTPHMMEYIIGMADKGGGDVYMSFLRNGRLHIAVRTGRDFFEMGKGSADAAQLRRKFIGEIRYFTDLIDELRLTDTIYKKG